jgi:hypothetical protein
MSSATGSLVLAVLFAFPVSLRADVIVSTSLSLTGLQISPSSGTLQILSPLTASAFAQAQDSLGGLDQQFNSVDDGTTSASALTLLASASGAASAPLLHANAGSGVNISGLEAAASSVGRGSLQGSFEITGATAPVNVQFQAMLQGDQSLSTPGTGQSATSEVIFTLILPDLPNQPLLFFDNPLTIGANDSGSNTTSPTLTASVTLQPNTEYSLITEVDAESSGQNAIPEPSSLLLLLTVLVLFGFSVARGEWLRRVHHAQRHSA